MDTTSDKAIAFSNNTIPNKSMAQNAKSKLATFPVELVEQVLTNLAVQDLIVAAAALPKFWRDVVENSNEIRKHIKSHKCRHYSPAGVLYVHRTAGGLEGYIHVSKDKALPSCILDPERTIAKYCRGSRKSKGQEKCSGQGFIKLFDLDGELVRSVRVYENENGLWGYISRYGNAVTHVDELYESYKY